MRNSKDLSETEPQDQRVEKNRELSILEALTPVLALVIMLFYNVRIFGDDSLSGSNQFILLLGSAIAVIIGIKNRVSFSKMMSDVSENMKSTSTAIFILLMVGALAGTWLVSGIIPTMIYYGLKLLNPTIFLPACLIICAIISVATGSSWTTSATVGIALIGIAEVLGIPLGMTAGAVLSGAYFGDKMSPMSDTTNLAPSIAGTDLFTHIKYMAYTTIPTFIVTLIVFIIIGITVSTNGEASISSMLTDIDKAFYISPWLFLVPSIVIFLVVKKSPPLIALFVGTILAAVVALFLQPEILMHIANASELNFNVAYKGLMKAITVKTSVPTDNEILVDLFSSGGMAKMMPTIWLLICAMAFGGVMDAIGALAKISNYLLQLFDSIFGLFASTVFTCIGLNLSASDQYMAIVVPGKMYAKAFKDKGLAPENLSRTLEDSGTVTSVLIPWNTCGAYHSGVLGVSVGEYFVYAIFNWLSPFTTLVFAALKIKIRQIAVNK